MGLRRTQPVTFVPLGVSDALDATNVMPGAMMALTNLVPDPTTKGSFVCRPASIRKTNFPAPFVTPGFVSALFILGTKAYGMLATGRNAGHDEPFCFDLVAGTFVTVTGTIDLTTTPVSPATAGAWTPPTMDIVGAKVLVTHPGFTGLGGVFFGWFDITNPALPIWNAGNLTGLVTFTTPPSAVKQFYQRAYWITNNPVQPAVIFSDVLAATVTTNANQVLTFGDTAFLTALGGLPLNNQAGGIIQALMVFKGVANIYQVTGDAAVASAPLTVNTLNVATGTLAPNSICPTPKGLVFMSPEGFRLIDFYAHVSDPVGEAGAGIAVPFIYAVVPSRVAAAYNANTLRVSVQNGFAQGNPMQEFWYNFSRQAWSGPHNFPASVIRAYNDTFVMAAVNALGSLWQSDAFPVLTSTFTENGTPMTFAWQTSLLPDNKQMAENAIIESAIMMSLTGGSTYTIRAYNEQAALLSTCTLVGTGSSTIWGAFTWGQAFWQGSNSLLASRQLAWPIPVVFKQASMAVTGPSSSAFRISNLAMRVEILGYLQQ